MAEDLRLNQSTSPIIFEHSFLDIEAMAKRGELWANKITGMLSLFGDTPLLISDEHVDRADFGPITVSITHHPHSTKPAEYKLTIMGGSPTLQFPGDQSIIYEVSVRRNLDNLHSQPVFKYSSKRIKSPSLFEPSTREKIRKLADNLTKRKRPFTITSQSYPIEEEEFMKRFNKVLSEISSGEKQKKGKAEQDIENADMNIYIANRMSEFL